MQPQTHVDKFGGTSVATPERIRRAAELVQPGADSSEDARRVVVVSALGGVTDELLALIDAALERTGDHDDRLDALRRRHLDAAEALAAGGDRDALTDALDARFDELAELIDGVSLLRECTARTRDAVTSTGERASALLVAAAFRAAGSDAQALDAARGDLVRTDDAFGEANVQFDATERLIHERFEALPDEQVAVVTGFIGTTERDVVTTLGRSGSDYTATLLAAALRAEQVTIWTDVDGVLSSDPGLVPEAAPLEQISYREAAEMAYFGAQVLHPRTMQPLQERDIPLRIKNTLRPERAGTLISSAITRVEGHVKAITTVRSVALVMLEGAGMIGTPGISARAFSALAERRINVLMISQASSEQNICIAVSEADAKAATDALEEAFAPERARGDVSRIFAQKDCAIVSAVGEEMRRRPGLAGRMFSTMGRSGVNVLAIAQGASETNISAVVRDGETQQAVRALHEAFALARTRAHVFLIGTGVVGEKFLELGAEQASVLLDEMSLNLQLVGLANTSQMVWDAEGIPFDGALERLAEEDRSTDLEVILERLAESRLDRLIVVDATASDTVARHYPDLLDERVAVITPNKRANTQSHDFYRRLQRASHRRRVPYLYETTVGAGLPILSTLRGLLDSGDRIDRIEGVFSGTLAYLFDALAAGRAFSEALREARNQGFTEPDPRDDLGGEDVARKLLILAREIGMPLERDDLTVESLVPPELMEGSVERFMERIGEVDADWQERVTEAEREDERLQYVGRITLDSATGTPRGEASVRVRSVGPESPFARLRGTDNMVVYTTARYQENPLVIQGPGAGPDVTAAGILSDVVEAAQRVS
ncbi:MAG: bifunctional aspartate kinase/homoserine dehydrogenase I [Bacteroidetes bacterium QS_8_68_15]|nr:MAG: bifunctional aspartate kinase/homoserine dehydrogenase I [Bacteroidetes bacterium QS_8_68_15]